MKSKKLLSLIFTSLVVGGMAFFASCEGPEGIAGADGLNGVDGLDGTAACGVCHDLSTDLYAKIVQYDASIHATGGNFERNGEGCSRCHTHEGFIEFIMSGTDIVAENPTPVNCRTCHPIHENYDLTDYGLRVTEAVTLTTGEVVDWGTGNMCINCHQNRIPSPMPVPGGADVTIGSPYWGVHHGPQTSMAFGIGGYEVAGSMTYTNSMHTTQVTDGCVTCHMGTSYGVQSGGHTFNMTYEYHGGDVVSDAGCVACHSDVASKIEPAKEELTILLDSLETVLIAGGFMDEAYHVIPGTLTADQAGAVLNFNFVREDRSHGSHNFPYAKALLTNSIESLE